MADRSIFGSPAVGAPPPLSAQYPGSTIGARVAAKNEAKRAIQDELGATDPLVNESIDDALEVTGFVMARGGSRRNRRGGAFGDEVKSAIKDIVTNIVDRVKRAGTKAETDAVAAVKAINAAGGELADASGRLGRASVMATAAYVAVKALDASGKYVPSPTWGQLGTGFAAFAKTVLVDLPATTIQASVSSPVVAIALATALTKLRAHYSGKSVADLVKQDLMMLFSKVTRGITGQIQGFQDANLETKKQMLIANLSEIKKNLKPGGKGYESISRDSILATENEANLLLEVMKAMETPPPEPAASSSSSTPAPPPAPSASSSSSSAAPPEESAVVAPPPAPSVFSSSSSVARRPTPSLLRIPSDREEAAEMAREKRFAAMTEERDREKSGPDRKKPHKDGGRRKTRRGKKVKRRVTHKVKFAY